MASSPLFDQINDVWMSSPNINTKTKPESTYMVNRFLSLEPTGFLAASDCNRMHKLPTWAALPFLKYATPKCIPPRNKYPKKLTQVKTLPPKKKRALELICKKFNITSFHGLQVMKLLEAQGFKLEAN